MNTRKCNNCGWEYPATWPGKTCKFCKAPMEGGICSSCGKFAEKLNKTNYRCTECSTKAHKAWSKGRVDAAEIEFSAWLEKIKQIPVPYTTLTEDEWLEACKHFGGCAYCGRPEIEARSMFIPFKLGGRYCAWNIIPACERCETSIKLTENPFKRMDDVYNRDKNIHTRRLGLSLDNLNRIVDYLKGRMQLKDD